MSGLLKKEIRLLLPSWAAAFVLAQSAWLITDRQHPASDGREVLVGLLFVLGLTLMVLMALSSFGRELGAGMLPNLLAQPVSRVRLWWTKSLLLATAMCSVWLAWWIAFRCNPNFATAPGERHQVFVVTTLFTVVAYAGGLWSVLLLRQVAAAFWFTLLIPASLTMLVAYVTTKLESTDAAEPLIIAVLAAYSIAGFLWARRLFLRSQDAHWTGGEIALPGWLRLPRRPTATTAASGHHPRRALLWKELQLHQSQFIIAGFLSVVHVIVILVRPGQETLTDSPIYEFVTYTLWSLWPIMALLIGCAAVAEERKLGTLEAQLCLPVQRRTQFIIKAGVALALALFFGVVMPLLLEGRRTLPSFERAEDIGQAMRPDALISDNFAEAVFQVISLLWPLLPFLPLILVSMVLCFASFYASSLARNTLQAIAPAILGIIMIWGLVYGAELIAGSHNPPWRGPLIYLIGVPALILALAGLAYWNFKRVLLGWPVWRRNLLTFLAVLISVMAVTSAVYHRAWELCLRLEPAHGSERLSRTEFPALHVEGNRIAARLPDGRLWQSIWLYDVMPQEGGRPSLINPQMLGGSNWAHVAHSIRQTETVAIQTDGSLWLLETPHTAIARTNNRLVVGRSEPTQLARIGNGTNWHKVIRTAWSPSFLLLKTDGSLWSWGTNRFDPRQKWPGLAAFEIKRFGEASDWANMACAQSTFLLWKTNGEAWEAESNSRSLKKAAVELAPGFTIRRYPELDRTRWRSLANSGPYQIQMGVRDDGTLWGWGVMAHFLGGPNAGKRIGREMNWAAVTCVQEAAGDLKVVALKTDGSLWRWDFSLSRRTDPAAARPFRLSSHNDWVAITGDWTGLVSLAADGSLWHWQFEPRPLHFAGFNIPPLLAASRRPQLLGNVFGDAAE